MTSTGNPRVSLEALEKSAKTGIAIHLRLLRDARNSIGFFTILPLSRAGSIKEVAAAGYLLPFVAVLLGLLEGAAAWGSSEIFGGQVAAAVILAAALLLTGLHHADGLADVGDAIMAHGDASRRIEVLKDRTLGIGAFGALLLTYLTSWAALSGIIGLRSGAGLLACLIAAELLARVSLLTTGVIGRPSHDGMGRQFIEKLKGWPGITGIVLSFGMLAVLALSLPLPALALAVAATGCACLALLVISRLFFGGVGGDVLGASVELGRLAALLGLLAGLNF